MSKPAPKIFDGPPETRRRSPTMESALRLYCGWSITQKTPKQSAEEARHVGHAIAHFGDTLVSEVKRFHLIDYRATRLRRLKPASVNREMATIRFFFNWLLERELVDFNPCAGIRALAEQNERVTILSRAERQIVIDRCQGEMQKLVLLSMFCGLRLGEIISLRWENVDLENASLRIESRNAKSKRSRVVPIVASLVEQMRGWGGEKPVKFVRAGWFQKKWREARKRFNFPKGPELHFHDIRHVFATTLLNECDFNLSDIQYLLGHSDIKTTQRYAHYDRRDLPKKIARLDGPTSKSGDQPDRMP